MDGDKLRYGVLGGSFDPPHYGHLALAETARVQLGLEHVLFVPAGQPPHKRAGTLSPAEARAAMVQAAITDNPAFALSRVDLDRAGPHYTAEMLALLRVQYPQVRDWFFLLGEDLLYDFSRWRDSDGILRQATLAVMPRRQLPADVGTLCTRFPQLAGRLVRLDAPPVAFSATDLRRRVRAGLPLRHLVPPAVEAYIREHGLYKAT